MVLANNDGGWEYVSGYDGLRIISYNGNEKEVVIPSVIGVIPVTEIGREIFTGKDILSVIIPASVNSIDSSAFLGSNLVSIGMPANVKIGSIYPTDPTLIEFDDGLSVFYNSQNKQAGNYKKTKYTYNNEFDVIAWDIEKGDCGVFIIGYNGTGNELHIPEKIDNRPVLSMAKNVFWNKHLESVTIPDSIVSISSGAFTMNKLTKVIIPEGVTFIGAWAFQNNELTDITLPSTIRSIDGWTFQGNKLTNVVIPSNVTSIARGAFQNNRLTSVIIPPYVTWIGNMAFGVNQITNITISANVSLEERAFEGGFVDFYKANGRQAGIYTYSNNMWTWVGL
jgi:hypothetical protein